MDSTEDDTFNRLKRASFYDVRKVWNERRNYGGLTEEYLKELGWTHQEYIQEHYRRWKNNEL